MDNASTDTAEHTEVNDAPVTDSANPVDNVEQSTATDTKSDNNTTPKVEIKDGKTYVNGIRQYSRDDVNKISANAKHEVERNILNQLNVDSIDQVQKVVSTLQEVNPTEGESLNVESLRDAVKKREATVEELKAQVVNLKQDLLLKDHMGKLEAAMPTNWTPTQRQSVVKLMKADNMLAVEGDTFAIKSGDEYLTVDGETPDYSKAVELVGKEILGLSMGKKGVDIQYGETSGESTRAEVKPVDQKKLSTDQNYRTAYMHIRKYRPNVSRESITNNMVMKEMESMKIK
jgi:hypothetical protein